MVSQYNKAEDKFIDTNKILYSTVLVAVVPVSVSLSIKNDGKVARKKVVQQYLSVPATKLLKPSEEPKAFAKTELL